MKKIFLTNSASQTQKIGKNLAEKILATEIPCSHCDGAIILALEGDLGGGKTTFLQGFAKGLKIKQKITSPTFVILKKFHISGFKFQNFYHIDCYRIEKPKEILDLDFKKIISEPKNIVAIEWSEKIKKILPKNRIIIKFKFVDKNTRKITISQ